MQRDKQTKQKAQQIKNKQPKKPDKVDEDFQNFKKQPKTDRQFIMETQFSTLLKLIAYVQRQNRQQSQMLQKLSQYIADRQYYTNYFQKQTDQDQIRKRAWQNIQTQFEKLPLAYKNAFRDENLMSKLTSKPTLNPKSQHNQYFQCFHDLEIFKEIKKPSLQDNQGASKDDLVKSVKGVRAKLFKEPKRNMFDKKTNRQIQKKSSKQQEKLLDNELLFKDLQSTLNSLEDLNISWSQDKQHDQNIQNQAKQKISKSQPANNFQIQFSKIEETVIEKAKQNQSKSDSENNLWQSLI